MTPQTNLPAVAHPSAANPEPLETRPNPDVPTVLTDEEVEEAARELGITYFRPAKVKALQKLGAFAGNHNVIHQGVGRLLAIDQTVMEVLDEMAAIVKDGEELNEIKVQAAGQVNSLANTLIRSVEITAEFQTKGHVKPKVAKRVFDDTPISPAGNNVQVNITGSATEVKVVDSSG